MWRGLGLGRVLINARLDRGRVLGHRLFLNIIIHEAGVWTFGLRGPLEDGRVEPVSFLGSALAGVGDHIIQVMLDIAALGLSETNKQAPKKEIQRRVV